ncbi:fatty acyl-AMP ligase [Nocardia araoensis]|uniref:fatty acyl-AMP ligase n=1 Tax=Nocardia araoensis TaxID=228600 RepID=UPI0002F81193|nr:fatty acyl-AMP ligase [Nocardia araoensis]
MPDTILLPDILERRAVGEPDRTAYVFLDENGSEAAALTYRELHHRALAVARELHSRCVPGDRALLVFPQSLDFIVAYFGCLYAGVIAVPVNPPRRDRVQDATRSIVLDCAPAAVLTLGALIAPLRPVLEPICQVRQWLAVDAMPAGRIDRPAVAAELDSVAFLQYTSGSTATPKGVMVTHRNLLANEEMIRRAFGHDRDSTVVGWAPFFHDQGLIGNVLQPLYVGATSVLMSPATFIRRPLLWLEAISRYRAHTGGGPDFAFAACVARASAGEVPRMDLSSWKVAFNGAEPIRAETLTRFAETFAPFGFDARALYPCYGLAEATLLVTGSRKGRGPTTLELDVEALGRGRYEVAAGRNRTVAGSGRVLPREELRIVDPGTGRVCPPDRIGEIWVSGDHVAQGYWEKPEATAETFQARCADDPARTYLRTGDLGVLVDGELYVVGRRKDVIIVRGRNYYPHDIERTVQAAHPALRIGGGAAFSVPGRDGEKIVVVQEVNRAFAPEGDITDIIGAIRAAVVREHELAVGEVVLTSGGQVQKTSSGKIMRAAARKRYLAGGFEIWSPHVEEPAQPRTRS